MSKTESVVETKARPGQDLPDGLSPAEAVKTALAGFVSDLGAFQADMASKFQQQEERIMKLDRKSLTRARPALASAADTEAPHLKAFAAYVRNGDDDALRGLGLEGKAMTSAVAGDGGYLVDPETSATIQSALNSSASLRSIATVVNVEATSYDVLIDTTDAGAGWANEADPSAETGTPIIERISIPLHELSALPKASQRLLDDSAFDIQDWLAGRIAEKFSRSEAAAFISGNGADKPTGFLTHATALAGTENWGELGFVATGVNGDFPGSNSGDSIIDLVYSLGAQYRANATFVMNSKTVAAVRKLKDSDGRFLWSDGLAASEPARLLGYPVLVAEDMPDIATDALAIAFGDFAAGYTIAERPDLRILRDPFSAKPHVLFYATKRVGGHVTDYNAIKVLKFSA